MEAQPLLAARLISPGSWRAAGSEGTRSGLPLGARQRRTLTLSLPLGETKSRLKLLGAGRCGRGCSSSCRTIWLSLRRKSGLTWRLPGHVMAAAATSRRQG